MTLRAKYLSVNLVLLAAFAIQSAYRHIMFECNGCFCELQCWTAPANWDDAQARFDEFLASAK
jgi:hypothetical protein